MSKGRYVDIYVEPNPKQLGEYLFSMEEGGVASSTLQFDKTKDKMKKSDDYKIEFKLHNRKGADLVFSQLADKVMWAMATSGPTGACPPKDSCFPGFYVDPTNFPQQEVLDVINTDKTKQFFSFCLNFVPRGTKEDKNTKYICYDPIGDNMDGGSLGYAVFPESISGTAVVLALVAVAIIVFVAYAFGLFAR
jgi:hypothetical protein